MKRINHWSSQTQIEVAESAGGVLAALNPLENLVRASTLLWPPPELLQKMYASDRWKGKTEEDARAVSQCLGHYCDLQSLNSEDAITWSFFGPLIYGPPEWQKEFAEGAFEALGLPKPETVVIWLWRRIPHPEKPASTGGPEIDFGLQSERCVVFGEAKWNSQLGAGQGIAGNRTQLDLRLAYCNALGRRAIPNACRWTILGIGRQPDVLDTSFGTDVAIHNLAWVDLIRLMPATLRPELEKYLYWKELHSNVRRHPSALPCIR
jgi:hypothetical protein